MAVLLKQDDRDPREYVLTGAAALIGRLSECQVLLDGIGVSRRHAQIVCIGNEYFLEDLNSRNGTYLNGQLVQGRKPLKDFDRLAICDLNFIFFENQVRDVQAYETPTARPNRRAVALDDLDEAGSSILSRAQLPSSGTGLYVDAGPEAKLKAVLEVARNLSIATSVEEVLDQLLESLLRVFLQADRAYVVQQNGLEGELVPSAVRYRREDSVQTVLISPGMVSKALETREALLSGDGSSDSRGIIAETPAVPWGHSRMCAPLINRAGEPLGVVQVASLDARRPFRRDDLDLLASVACQAAIALENAQLHEQARRLNAETIRMTRLEEELRLARHVQQNILPTAPPCVPGYEFFEFYESASQVGGDYFDYIPLSDNRLAVLVADVAGKGIAAALLVAKLSSDTRYCLATHRDPAEAMTQLNNGLYASGWSDRFVTMVMIVLDWERHVVSVVNAGHMPPLLRRATGEVEPLGHDAGGFPLGVLKDTVYERIDVALESGDAVTMFTDGVSEANDAAYRQYTVERLSLQVAAPAVNMAELGSRILDDIEKFVGSFGQSDDLCLICFRRL